MMKSPFIKVRRLGLHRHDKHDRQAIQRSLSQLDELSQASQDMENMRDCYDSLLSAAAGTANNAYEFSESLQEMGDCLLEKTALNDDEDSGRVLLMLGKVQFDIQKLIDNYRSHISQTITVPSESLLNELHIVEDMKKQCDEKRMTYEEMKKQYDEGRMKSSKGEYVSSRQLQSAWAEFDEAATLFILRMKSLKRGQSRSLLTQAARHHAAQVCFFRKALNALEAIEPHVKSATEQQHIDYHFSGLEDDDRDSVILTEDEDDEDEDESDDYYCGVEDSGLNFDDRMNVSKNEVSSSGKSLEFDNGDLKVPQVVSAKENMYGKPLWNPGSKSAPLSAESTNERFRQMRQSSTRKLTTYALPTPSGIETRNSQSTLSGIETRNPQPSPPTNMWHSMPLEQKKHEKIIRNSGPMVSSKQPMGSKTTTLAHQLHISGSLLTRQSSTGEVSSHIASVALPMISELHELPRPPAKKTSRVGFSAPLVKFRGGPDLVDANKLPLPVPSRSQRQTETWISGGDEGRVSPPVSPIPVRN